jgi:hypothetical protein
MLALLCHLAIAGNKSLQVNGDDEFTVDALLILFKIGPDHIED